MTDPAQIAKSLSEAQKAGATARAIGMSFLCNPYYDTEKMPVTTGQSVAEWERFALAWELGWRMDDLMDV